MSDEQFIPDPNAVMFGAFAAMQGAIRALIQTHPNPLALIAKLHNEKETSLAMLMNSTAPDAAIQVFESTMASFLPESSQE